MLIGYVIMIKKFDIFENKYINKFINIIDVIDCFDIDRLLHHIKAQASFLFGNISI